MQHIGRRTILVTILLLIFASAIIPLKKIRLGKDLRGGSTLIYQLEIEPGEDASSVVSSTIAVLKDRVDPNGLYEITIVPQGRDRLEITMPLPSKEMQALRKAVDDALDAFAATSLTRSTVVDALEMSGDARLDRLTELSAGNARRMELLTAAAEAEDAHAASERELKAIEDEFGSDSFEATEALRKTVIPMQRARDLAIGAVINSAPDADEIRIALEKPRTKRLLFDSRVGKRVDAPSPRERSIQKLKEKYPEVADQIDEVVAKHDAYLLKRTTLDDPSDLKRLLADSGELSFRITVDASSGTRAGKPRAEIFELRRRLQEEGPVRARASDARWFRINKIESWFNDLDQERRLYDNPAAFFEGRGGDGYVVEEFEGEFWMLCWDVPGSRLVQGQDAGDWGVANSFQGVDDIGRPAISFVMDAPGAALLGQLTGDHVQDNMAVLLDDQVFTAPNLNSRISKRGIIMGEFSPQEIEYVVKVLSAGSLQGKLTGPISENTIGPDLGADNLLSGLWAGIFALMTVSAFMVVYYFRCGMIAVLALGCNALMILGALSMNSAALTLPGIAGIILTFGMAVDANVLIYERVREELRGGADAKTAVRLGFKKATSSIVDGNVTNLIVCIVLALPGVSTQEVKGFAITLGIGVIATMFSALVIARLIFAWLIQYGHWRKIKMLPMAVPALERALEPKVNWLGLRWIFVFISTGYVGLGLFMVFTQGSKMLDTEFTGGSKITLTFKADENGEPMTLDLSEARQKVLEEIPARAGDNDDPDDDVLLGLRSAEVIPLNPQGGGTVSNQFQIRTSVEDVDLIKAAMSEEFRDLLDEKPSIGFAGSSEDVTPEIYELVFPMLSDNFHDPEMQRRFSAGNDRDLSAYIDGVVVMLRDLNPPPSLDDLRVKLESWRQSAYPQTLSRTRDLIILEGSNERVRSAALVVADGEFEYSVDQVSWRSGFALQEWQITREGLERVTTLAQVDQFSSAIAQTFKSRAIAAIVLSLFFITIYIWVRFGNMRYSLAAMLCLVHDVLTVIGLIALSEILYNWNVTSEFVRSLGIQPFKIDLNMVAAILTIIGYSLNDTIIVMDRIRENRGKLPYASADVINDSINQTISRTIITSGTTFLAALILYIYGGEGVRAFSFALLMGVLVGTYSSIAVAAPLVWSRQKDSTDPSRDSGLIERV